MLRTPVGILLALQLLYAVAVCCYFYFLMPRGAPAWPGDSWRAGTAPIAVVNLVSFALALLLVHRIQTVNGRWWEARAAWGQIFNACRNVARLLAAWLAVDGDASAIAARWTTALPLVARHHLRRHAIDVARPDMITALTAAEAEWLLVTAGHHTPTAAASVLEALINSSPLPHEMVLAATTEINTYINAVGTCERIRGTNQPLAITRLTSRLLQAWLALLPWCLWPACGWFTILIHGTLSFMLINIEWIGARLEDAVSRLPLIMYANALADDVRHVWKVAAEAAAVSAGAPPPVTCKVAGSATIATGTPQPVPNGRDGGDKAVV